MQSSTVTSTKISPSSPRGDGVTDRSHMSSPASPSCAQPPTDGVTQSHDRGDEGPPAVSPSTEAGRYDVEAGEEADRLDVVELDTACEYSATDEPASESTHCGMIMEIGAIVCLT